MSADPAAGRRRRPALELGDGLRFDPPLLLAPMEGVTDRSFRRLTLESNPGAVGATCTEFIRVTAPPIPARRLAPELDPRPRPAPLGLQLMGNRPDMVAATAVHAAEAGADWVDLNFGCPAPRVYQHCAGSALLDDPAALETLLRAVVEACPLPVTAKIRAGGDDDARLEEIAQRIEQAGARLLTVHARLRVERYQDPADWRRIERAVAAVGIPVVGNGSADSAAAIEAMFEQTGCAGVMVGRGAMANPWVFQEWLAERLEGSGAEAPPPATAPPPAQATPPAPGDPRLLPWLHRYAAGMAEGGAKPLQTAGRLKMMLRCLTAAGRLPLGTALPGLLRLKDPGQLLAETERALAGPEPARSGESESG